MNEPKKGGIGRREEELCRTVGEKEARKIRARRQKYRSIWFGLGMFGLIGWSVAIPTLIGVAIGIYIDRNWPSQISWTLTLLFVGMVLGCLNAWHWLSKERAKIDQEKQELLRDDAKEKLDD